MFVKNYFLILLFDNKRLKPLIEVSCGIYPTHDHILIHNIYHILAHSFSRKVKHLECLSQVLFSSRDGLIMS